MWLSSLAGLLGQTTWTGGSLVHHPVAASPRFLLWTNSEIDLHTWARVLTLAYFSSNSLFHYSLFLLYRRRHYEDYSLHPSVVIMIFLINASFSRSNVKDTKGLLRRETESIKKGSTYFMQKRFWLDCSNESRVENIGSFSEHDGWGKVPANWKGNWKRETIEGQDDKTRVKVKSLSCNRKSHQWQKRKCRQQSPWIPTSKVSGSSLMLWSAFSHVDDAKKVNDIWLDGRPLHLERIRLFFTVWGIYLMFCCTWRIQHCIQELHTSRNKHVTVAKVQPRQLLITIYSVHIHKQPRRYLKVNASAGD